MSRKSLKIVNGIVSKAASGGHTGLPPFVVLKGKRPGPGEPDLREWYVRMQFPTGERGEGGRAVYAQVARKCYPPTADRAAEIVADLRSEFRFVTSSAEGPESLDQFLDRFLAIKKGSVARRTYEHYEELRDRYVKGAAIADRRTDEIRTADVQAFYTYLLERTGAPTVRKVHTLLTMAFGQAVKWDQLVKNPCKGVILPKARRKEIVIMNRDEARRFIAACRADLRFAIFELALETAMRPGECLGLTWKDVDLERRIITVKQSASTKLKGGGFEIKDPKTKMGKRFVHFSEQLKQRLEFVKAAQATMLEDLKAIAAAPILLEHKKARGVNYEKRKRRQTLAKRYLDNFAEHDLVFPNEKGLPMSLNNLGRRDFAEVVALAKINKKGLTPYSLRHTCITLSLAAGVNVKAISEKAGHASVQLTLDTYAHVLPSMQAEASEILSSSLYGDDKKEVA
jgi:integrase